MDTDVAELSSKYPSVVFKREDYRVTLPDRSVSDRAMWRVSNLAGSPELVFTLIDSDDVKGLGELLAVAAELFRGVLGFRQGNDAYVLLSPVGFKGIPYYMRREESTPIRIDTHYAGKPIAITITSNSDSIPLQFVLDNLRNLRRRWRRPVVAHITGLEATGAFANDSEIRTLLRSVLFDFEYVYGIALEPIVVTGERIPRMRFRRRFPAVPNEPIPVVYKPYISELIEYYHAGEKVDYLPFRYVCYYHVLEYFADKSAYAVVSQIIKSLLLRPDFHLKSDYYVNRAIQIIRKETDRNTSDRQKLIRVLRQFIEIDDIQAFLNDSALSGHFGKECTLACAKPLVLPALDLTTEPTFCEKLSRRIYSLRCSIVHSNPDFEDEKAIPFIPNEGNLEVLALEVELMREIARTVMLKSART